MDVLCPAWWPLPDHEPIGDERVRELMRYLRMVAPRAVASAVARYPQLGATRVCLLPAGCLASLALDPGMRGICIGAASSPGAGGGQEIIDVALTRAGRVAFTINSVDGGQNWIDISRRPIRLCYR